MGNKSWGGGYSQGVDDGYDMAKDDFKEKTGFDFDKFVKTINKITTVLKKFSSKK